jgi:hypothetical protein
MSVMPNFQVIVRGKDNEPETYDIKADDFKTVGAGEQAAYHFHVGSEQKTVALFQISQVVAVIDKDSQK